jgi:hypothetical protein
MRRETTFSLLVLAAVCTSILVGPSARAGLVDLRGLAAADPNLVHQWTFEGTFPLHDQKASSNLSQVNAGSPPAKAKIDFSYGGQGFAARTSHLAGSVNNGSALKATGGFTPPNSGTMEYLFRAEDNAGGHIVSQNPGSNRMYFGLNDGAGWSSDPPAAAVGFGNPSWPNPRAEFLTNSSSPNFEAGHWYYVAVPYQFTGSSFDFDVYVADLTEGQTTLAHPVAGASRSASGSLGNAPLGIGMQGNTNGNFFDGYVDEVAMYNTQLSAAALQGHLDAVHLTPPLSAVVSASDDAYIENGSGATSNYGSNPIVRIGTGGPVGGNTGQGLLKFDLSSIPSSATVLGVTLQATQTDGFVENGFNVYQLTSDWNEGTVTWSTAPGVGGLLGTMSVNPNWTNPVIDGLSALSDPDLTALVQGWIDGSVANYGLNLQIVGGGGDTLASKEDAGAPFAPRLVIDYAVTIIPEPATLLIWSLLAGLGIGVGWRRRKR